MYLIKCTWISIFCLISFGCSVDRYELVIPLNDSKNNPQNNPDTFAKLARKEISFKHVQEHVISSSCVSCHSEAGGNKGKINFENYQNVQKNLIQLKDSVLTRSMPPQEAKIFLTNNQIMLIVDWIECGAKEVADGSECTSAPPPIVQPSPFEVVYNKVIATNCIDCHSEAKGNKGEVNLETYENIFKYKDSIRTEVINKTMPTKKGKPLTDEQIKLIIDWIDQGAQK